MLNGSSDWDKNFQIKFAKMLEMKNCWTVSTEIPAKEIEYKAWKTGPLASLWKNNLKEHVFKHFQAMYNIYLFI